ncbi:hypothetical protein [Methylobacterium sp. P1-11]|uniref:hypothetical protein n=1 Tax=Methylobacterium sp. P1-11 TaxID=2024616 RepID=UPI001564E2CB|nr:hypothetical protein [Methylobacterium sp. P1-11]
MLIVLSTRTGYGRLMGDASGLGADRGGSAWANTAHEGMETAKAAAINAVREEVIEHS